MAAGDGQVEELRLSAHRSVMPSVDHHTARYENNRAEVSHQLRSENYRLLRARSFKVWSAAIAA